MATIYMGRMSNITDRFFRVFTDRYEFIEHISILQFFLDFIDEKKQSRLEKISNTIEWVHFSNIRFSYPKPAQAEINFLDIKIATLKRILWKQKDDYTLDELHMYEEAKKEAKIENPEILHGINMSFEKWKLYGVVWKNGAGKSTLTSLLLGFFSEYSGSLRINNQELNTIKREQIHSIVSYVSQEPYIMHWRFTIRDNLMLGVDREISDEELYGYLEMFGMKEKIKKEREWLNTRLKWDMDLSGGQKQILVLIRVILQDRPILILDEGTNQLDAENEMRVMNALLKNRKDKIILFVTHRMNTMKKCDWIYTLVDGTIEDQWTPRELATRENAFSRFVAIWEQEF